MFFLFCAENIFVVVGYNTNMSVWATKRKIVYLSIVLVGAVLWFVLFVLPKFQTPPTCTDGIQNGKEEGIDCGGNCPLYCPALAQDLSVVWSRVFRVVPGRYNAVAMVENQNTATALASISYEFRLYDDNNVFVGRRTGETFIAPNTEMAIFEAGIETGDRVPVRSEFSFISTPTWLQIPQMAREGIPVSTSNIVLQDPFTNPRLKATVKNNSRFDLFNFEVSAILYNQASNVIAASQTVVDNLASGESREVYFTWQDNFSEDPVRIEIVPQIDVFGLFQYR